MKPKILVILGSTSTGKTDLALELAKKLNGELVSADSRQLYKYLDLGTGKLPGEYETLSKSDNYWQIDGIKVWMYDVASPEQRFNLYQYILIAQEIIYKITASGKSPILIGGTGLYIRSLLEGISDFGSEENNELRKELEELSLKELQEKIKQTNSGTLENLNNSEINNKRRLIRIYEKLVTAKSKQTFTGLEKDFNVLKIGLFDDRQTIRERIKKRIIKRIDDGMIEESKNLLNSGKLTYERMAELGLEYKYIAKYLKGEIKTIDELIETLSLKIGQYAKRQETWFKKEKSVNWFNISEPNFTKQVEKLIADWYNMPK